MNGLLFCRDESWLLVTQREKAKCINCCFLMARVKNCFRQNKLTRNGRRINWSWRKAEASVRGQKILNSQKLLVSAFWLTTASLPHVLIFLPVMCRTTRLLARFLPQWCIPECLPPLKKTLPKQYEDLQRWLLQLNCQLTGFPQIPSLPPPLSKPEGSHLHGIPKMP